MGEMFKDAQILTPQEPSDFSYFKLVFTSRYITSHPVFNLFYKQTYFSVIGGG